MQSRYYNPEWGRFTNADGIVGFTGELLSHNMFAYCMNNPVMNADPSGYFLDTLLDVASIGMSIWDLVKDPSLLNVGFLVWDIGAAVLPFIPGSYIKKGVKAFSKLDDVADGSKGLKMNLQLFAKGAGETILKNSRIDEKVLKKLKGMGLDKKFKRALDIGFAPRREGTSGVIKLSTDEFITKKGFEYTFKLKVPKAGGHTRVYGRINDSGELIFDLILKK